MDDRVPAGRGSTIEQPANDEAPRSASGWFIALREAPGERDLRARFEAWLAADPSHPRDWDEVNRLWATMGQSPPEFADRWRGFAARRRAGRRSWRLGAAAAVAAICLLLPLAPGFLVKLKADQRTGSAETRIVRLEDGSVVHLAPRSAIAYEGGRRHVRLIEGEAFFEVVHDAADPFTVEAKGVKVTDIGTAFDVRARPAGEAVAVRQGIVEAASRRLAAGDWIRIDAGGQVEQGHGPAEEAGSWTRGQLVAKNRSVADIVEDIRPYFDGVILVRGDELARTSLTGVYNLDDPIAALQAVASVQGASIYRLTPWVIVVSGT